MPQGRLLCLKIANLKSPITDNKFPEHAAPLYLLSVIGDFRFVIFKNYFGVDDLKEGRAQVPPLQILAKRESILGLAVWGTTRVLRVSAVSLRVYVQRRRCLP